MIDFIHSLFKSEETKINEEYEYYKEKYRDKIKILRQGTWYAVDSNNLIIKRVKHEPVFIYTELKQARSRYIEICKYYEQSLNPVVEV